MRADAVRAQRALVDGYLRRIIDRDVPEAGREVRNPAALRGWLDAYTAATSTTASYETIRDAAKPEQGDKPARTTTGPYRDVLTRLWIVDPIGAWAPTRNHLAKLQRRTQAPPCRPGAGSTFGGCRVDGLLAGEDGGPRVPRDGTLLGALFESLVTLDVRVYAQAAEAQVRHLRTKGGEREVDLIVARDDQRIVAIEVKLSATVGDDDVRQLRWLADRLGPDSSTPQSSRPGRMRTDGRTASLSSRQQCSAPDKAALALIRPLPAKTGPLGQVRRRVFPRGRRPLDAARRRRR